MDHCQRCHPAQLCEHCYGRALLAKRGPARVLGQMWAERLCRGELRALDEWPADPEHDPVAAREVISEIARDPRMVEDLAAACLAGAADWWRRRPARYRG